MKKTLAILLALVLVLANVAALAEEAAESITPETITVAKNYVKDYTNAESDESTVKPAEELEFTIEQVSAPADVDLPEVAAEVDEDGITTGMTITFPAYTKVGLYTYTVKETAGSSQGAQYNSEDMTLKVFIFYDEENNHALASDVGITVKVQDAEEGDKSTEIYNEYNVGKLTVGKTVSGNLSSTTAEFNVTVTFTAEKQVNSDITVSKAVKAGDADESDTIAKGWTGSKEITFTLHDSETVDFTNIPAGVTYTFTESDEHKLADGEDFDPNSDEDKQYTVTGEVTSATEIAADAEASATINNDKNIEIDTGVSLETVPYIMILAVVMIGAALLVLRKREEY